MGTKAISKTALIEVNSPDEVPVGLGDDEFAEFWDTHVPTERYFEAAGEATADGLPPPRARTSPVSIRFDPDTLARLKAVARKKRKGYQTLLKEFVAERLYEEEKREGLVGS